MATTIKQPYQWQKTALKVLKQVLIVGIAGLAAVYGDNPYYLIIAPFLTGLENVYKNW